MNRYTNSLKETEGKNVARQKIVRIRVLNTMTKWMESHPHHFYKELVRQSSAFIETIPDKEGKKLRKALQRLNEGTSSSRSQIKMKNMPPPKPILPSASSFPITSIDPKELARQVSLMERMYQ